MAFQVVNDYSQNLQEEPLFIPQDPGVVEDIQQDEHERYATNLEQHFIQLGQYDEEEKQPQVPPQSQEVIVRDSNYVYKMWETTWALTKQRLLEHFGRATVSKDSDLIEKLNKLEEIKSRYDRLLDIGFKYCDQLNSFLEIQAQFGAVCAVFSTKEVNHLQPIVEKISTSTRKVTKNYQEILVPALSTFLGSIVTFRQKALEDTLETVRKYEKVRLEYDAYAARLSELQNSVSHPKTLEKIQWMTDELAQIAKNYLRLSEDIQIKIDMLEDKRVRDEDHWRHFYNAFAHLFLSSAHIFSPPALNDSQ